MGVGRPLTVWHACDSPGPLRSFNANTTRANPACSELLAVLTSSCPAPPLPAFRCTTAAGLHGAVLRAGALWLLGVCGAELGPAPWGEALALVVRHLASPDLVVALMAVSALTVLLSNCLEESQFVGHSPQRKRLMLEGAPPGMGGDEEEDATGAPPGAVAQRPASPFICLSSPASAPRLSLS